MGENRQSKGFPQLRVSHLVNDLLAWHHLPSPGTTWHHQVSPGATWNHPEPYWTISSVSQRTLKPICRSAGLISTFSWGWSFEAYSLFPQVTPEQDWVDRHLKLMMKETCEKELQNTLNHVSLRCSKDDDEERQNKAPCITIGQTLHRPCSLNNWWNNFKSGFQKQTCK